MHSTPFNSETDLPPIPFDRRLCEMAAQLKEAGLPWSPHVGCFAWDRDEHIQVPSPFPERIYFILNLGRFLEIFGSLEGIIEKLIWIPTWHQAQLICTKMGLETRGIMVPLLHERRDSLDDMLFHLYEIILKKLKNELP